MKPKSKVTMEASLYNITSGTVIPNTGYSRRFRMLNMRLDELM